MEAISELMVGEISKEQFLKINTISEIGTTEIEKGLMKAYQSQCADSADEFIYLIFKFEIFDKRYIAILHKLLVSDWHYQHENIVWILQRISSFDSVKYLYDAIELNSPYLGNDENCAFKKKCVRAIYQIGKEKSISYLKKLCEHPNSIIREIAQRQIKKLI